MNEYTKINTIWKRDERGRIVEGDYATPEFAYLAGSEWEWTEKVDGTNIRVGWNGSAVEFGGRTADAQIPARLIAGLRELFDAAPFAAVFGESPAVLYGEGYGAGIQSSAKVPDAQWYGPVQTFVLFDVTVGPWWLGRDDVADVAQKMSLRTVPVIGRGTLPWASERTKSGLTSEWGEFPAEGMVGRPLVDLYTRKGERVIAKIKSKDFR